MPLASSAHAHTNPREQLSDITATGVNNVTVAKPLTPPPSSTTPVNTSPGSVALKSKLSTTLPPLIFGTATFNYQFNKDPYALNPYTIVAQAFKSGIRAFDTSPYYGPAEQILGEAFASPLIAADPVLSKLQREDYFILTKAGRVAASEFDYSADWLRFSIARSLKRLRTSYLDVVYLHDVEFVSPAEVVSGIRTLRELRDSAGVVKYVGICGYPVDTLCDLADLVLAETGEPLDIVQSYANFTLQNQRLLSRGLERLATAGVDIVPNASPLGMGLCRSQGPPVGAMGNWHPAPDGLRAKCTQAADWVEKVHGEKLETVAVRFAMEGWLMAGAGVGSQGLLPTEADEKLKGHARGCRGGEERARVGVNVMGVSKISELEETMAVYNSVVAATEHADNPGRKEVDEIVRHVRTEILGKKWTDFAWESPEPGFVNQRSVFGASAREKEEVGATKTKQGTPKARLELKTEAIVEVSEAVLPIGG